MANPRYVVLRTAAARVAGAGPAGTRSGPPAGRIPVDSIELAVEPLRTAKDPPEPAYVAQHVFGLLELTAMRRIAQLKSRLQRTNPVEQTETFNRMFGELAALEQHRRGLRDRIVGAS